MFELFAYKETELQYIEVVQNIKLKYLRNYTQKLFRIFTAALSDKYLSNMVETHGLYVFFDKPRDQVPLNPLSFLSKRDKARGTILISKLQKVKLYIRIGSRVVGLSSRVVVPRPQNVGVALCSSQGSKVKHQGRRSRFQN